eukprot:1456463-Alexandrium_andersonii.AAC.1
MSGGLATTRCGVSVGVWPGRVVLLAWRCTPPRSARPSCAGMRPSAPAKGGRRRAGCSSSSTKAGRRAALPWCDRQFKRRTRATCASGVPDGRAGG